LAFLVVATGLAGYGAWRIYEGVRGSPRSATDVAAELTSSFDRGQLASVRFTNATGHEAGVAWRSLRAGMDGAHATVSVLRASTSGTRAVATLHWRWQLPFDQRWSYQSTLTLRNLRGRWRPVWSARLVNADLASGRVLKLSLRQPRRAAILSAGGQPLVTSRAVVYVGIEPSRVRNLPGLVHTLHVLLGVQSQPLIRAARASPPNEFVPVITLRRADYESVRAKIHPLPGTVFRTGVLPLAQTRPFARSLLGTVGQATAQIISLSHGSVLPGEIVGLSGLERTYDARLAGRPGLLVQAVKPAGKAHPLGLYQSTAHPGRPLQTTLEPRAQLAADAALASVRKPSALVAVRISTGSVIAVSIGPNPGGFDTALLGHYPPGSTFKVVTALALLQRGLQPGTTVDCPSQFTVDGKSFHNAEHELLGPTTFARDFARSCNTAFVSLAARLNNNTLPRTARMLGIGRPLRLGIPAYAGNAPAAASKVELAADAIGQGRILVSPLAMANAAAAIARGRWQSPRLITTSKPPASGLRLPPAAITTLRTLMRQAVTSGTGTALANQPGPPVYGKTGTAETGTHQPPQTDAWFIGYQGDIAFAALVANTNNNFGGTTAAPIIAHFLTNLTH
jgi:cell division protein FtsI/penicillin-binding protein 2